MQARLLLLSLLLLLAAGCGAGPKPPARGREPKPVFRKVHARVVDVLKRSNQAAIDVGSADGVYPGCVFEVYRRRKLVGRVRVEHVWEQRCGGRIFDAEKPMDIGDYAVAFISTRPPAKGRPPKSGSTPGTVRTQLLDVRVKQGQVVLGAGAKAGVKAGKVFYIYRGDRYLGRVKVTLVKPGLSGARIIESREAFKPGDRAVYDPEDERRDAYVQPSGKVDPAEVIRRLEARIKDPKTSAEERATAREVLERLQADGVKKKPEK